MTYYLIDSENMGESWLDILDAEWAKDAQFEVFYTDRSSKISYANLIKVLGSNAKLKFTACSTGNNALDFQLVSYLGYMLHQEPDAELIIVSNDTGFDAVCKFWSERGMSVSRIGKKALAAAIQGIPVSGDVHDAERTEPADEEMCAANCTVDVVLIDADDAVDAEAAAMEVARATDEVRTNGEAGAAGDVIKTPFSEAIKNANTRALSEFTVASSEPFEASQADLDVILACFGKKASDNIYNLCIHLYGADNGLEVYRNLKAMKFKGHACDWDKSEKFYRLVKLIVEHSFLSVEKLPVGFILWLEENIIADKKKMQKRIATQYPKRQYKVSEDLHRVFKAYYKDLKAVK